MTHEGISGNYIRLVKVCLDGLKSRIWLGIFLSEELSERIVNASYYFLLRPKAEILNMTGARTRY